MSKKQRGSAISHRSHFFAALPVVSLTGALACLLALDAGSPLHAQKSAPLGTGGTSGTGGVTLTPAPSWTVSHPTCPDGKSICVMTIKIFNDDPNHWIYPVLTTGKGRPDIWMQAWWSVPKAYTDTDKWDFPRRKVYRLYINPTGTGIPPGTGVELTIPLFTQLKEPINANPPADSTPTGGDTYINWWNGAVIQVFVSDTASPPQALVDARNRTTQASVKTDVTGAILPTCVGVSSAVPNSPAPPPCQALGLYSDDSNIPEANPFQLIEYTFGARNDPKDINIGPRYLLDTANVDFDISYVNTAFAPAVVGPYKNNQVGYVGTPITINAFIKAITNPVPPNPPPTGFLEDYSGWPQFRLNGVLLNKLASPLEAFARLSGAAPPPDLTQVPGWPGTWPATIWAPLQTLRANWITYAGSVVANGNDVTFTQGICGALPSPDANPQNFCDTLVAIQKLMIENYKKYRGLFASGQCVGGINAAVKIDDNLLIKHVYGWTPWTEANTGKDGDGCQAAQNLLEDTPGYSKPNPPPNQGSLDYTNYLNVKVAFDKLNYGTQPAKPGFPTQIYNFNPWVQFIHGVPDANPPKYVNTPYAYAYSVDDAMGNVQAEGQGIIIDIGSVLNLENKNPATVPLLVTLGAGNAFGKGIVWTSYAVCDINNKKNINPNFTTFEVNGTNPSTCPVYLWDNKAPPQLYAFKIDATDVKTQLPLISDPAKQIWTPGTASADVNTTKMVQCYSIPNFNALNGWQWSSMTKCCDKASSSGFYAFAQPEPHNAHNTRKYIIQGGDPKPCKDDVIPPAQGGTPEIDARARQCYFPTNPPNAEYCNKGVYP